MVREQNTTTETNEETQQDFAQPYVPFPFVSFSSVQFSFPFRSSIFNFPFLSNGSSTQLSFPLLNSIFPSFSFLPVRSVSSIEATHRRSSCRPINRTVIMLLNGKAKQGRLNRTMSRNQTTYRIRKSRNREKVGVEK